MYCFTQRNVMSSAVWPVCTEAINLTSFVTESELVIDYSTLHLHSSSVQKGRQEMDACNWTTCVGRQNLNVYREHAERVASSVLGTNDVVRSTASSRVIKKSIICILQHRPLSWFHSSHCHDIRKPIFVNSLNPNGYYMYHHV